MPHMIKGFFIILITSFCLINKAYTVEVKPEVIEQNKSVGLLKFNDPKLDGLIWSGWGSRPYEYKWVSSLVDLKGQRVIDLGMGLPSQNSWCCYVIWTLKPLFYTGVEINNGMIKEAGGNSDFEVVHMDMRSLKYPEGSYDIAYAIGTFSSMTAADVIKSISEAYRVLKDDGILIVTLEERWDKNVAYTSTNKWNTLEQSLKERGMVDDSIVAFGMPQFIDLVKDYFVPYEDNLVITAPNKIHSTTKNIDLYVKNNRDPNILNGGDTFNGNVSYIVLKKNLTEVEP